MFELKFELPKPQPAPEPTKPQFSFTPAVKIDPVKPPVSKKEAVPEPNLIKAFKVLLPTETKKAASPKKTYAVADQCEQWTEIESGAYGAVWVKAIRREGVEVILHIHKPDGRDYLPKIVILGDRIMGHISHTLGSAVTLDGAKVACVEGVNKFIKLFQEVAKP